jgi:hypothetical protein
MVIRNVIHAAFMTVKVKYVIYNQFSGHKNENHAEGILNKPRICGEWNVYSNTWKYVL